MDSIMDLLVFIAVIYGLSKKMQKKAQKSKETSKPSKYTGSNLEDILQKKKAPSLYIPKSKKDVNYEGQKTVTYDSRNHIKKDIPANIDKQGAVSIQQSIEQEIQAKKNLIRNLDNIIKEKQVTDEIYKKEIGSPKISFNKDSMVRAIIMSELLEKPKALRK